MVCVGGRRSVGVIDGAGEAVGWAVAARVALSKGVTVALRLSVGCGTSVAAVAAAANWVASGSTPTEARKLPQSELKLSSCGANCNALTHCWISSGWRLAGNR